MEASVKVVDDYENRSGFRCPFCNNGAVFSFGVALAHEGLNPDF
jgi:hypothetical protein